MYSFLIARFLSGQKRNFSQSYIKLASYKVGKVIHGYTVKRVIYLFCFLVILILLCYIGSFLIMLILYFNL